LKISNGICEVQNKELINNTAMMTSYKVKGGGIVNVKSTFNNQRSFRNAIYPAIISALKSKEKA